jgi:hypothetical protein
MGLGVVLLSPDGDRRERSCLAQGHGCNNEAELHALCLAIDLALAAGRGGSELRGDSDVAVRYVTGVASTAVARLLPLIARQVKGWRSSTTRACCGCRAIAMRRRPAVAPGAGAAPAARPGRPNRGAAADRRAPGKAVHLSAMIRTH